MDKVNGTGSAVVARFLDGSVLKGTTHDFAPHKTSFHLCAVGDPAGKPLLVPFNALKAIFFVRTFEGDPKHVEDLDLEKAQGPGRKIVVTFPDGEVLSGVTTSFSKDKPGFFVTPVDPHSNNGRVFVIAGSMKSVAWGAVPAPARDAR